MAYLYRHIRLDKNEPFYIGIGSDSKGKYTRSNNKTKRNEHWKNIAKITPYKIDIMLDDISWEEANKKEIEFIALYGRRDLNKGTLVNLTNGGDGTLGMVFTDKHKDKISKKRLEGLSKGTIKVWNAGTIGVSKPNSGSFTKGQKSWNVGLEYNSERRLNTTPRKDKSSKYKGVTFIEKANKWCAKIKVNNKTKNLGYFDTEIEAYNKYLECLKMIDNKDYSFMEPVKFSSKIKGISFNKTKNKWVASKMVNYKNVYLGSYNTEKEAINAINMYNKLNNK